MEESTIWYYENEAPRHGVRVGFAIKGILRNVQTQFQQLQVLETLHFGRMMVLDSCVMLTERDEFIYHEMIAHPALFAHPNPKRVLVIGGGDGGTLREAARHRGVEELVLCEIDGDVIQAARDFFPSVACGFDDPRVKIRVEDAVKYVRESENRFDVIIIDSADPIGPGIGLFQEDFYRAISRALTKDGVMSAQGESPYLHRQTVKAMHGALRNVFPITGIYSAFIPTYPSGWWSFAYASKTQEACEPAALARIERAAFPTRYHTAAMQQAAFVQPPFVTELFEDRP